MATQDPATPSQQASSTSDRRRSVVTGLVLLAAVAGGVVVPYLYTRSSPAPVEESVTDKPSPKGESFALAPVPEKLTPALPQAIESAEAYLNRVVDSRGRFRYIQYADGRKIDDRKYNILRHAGSIYALSMMQEHGEMSEKTRDAMKKSAKYLVENYVDAIKGHQGLKAVFSLPGEEIGNNKSERQAKLGGTALGMIALLAARKLDPEIVPLETLQALGRFVQFMQKEDGGFHSKFSESKAFSVDFESLFYPGEAILALVRLYQADGDTQWLASAARAAKFLVDSREGKTPPPDHWLLIATPELIAQLPNLPKSPGMENSQLNGDALYAHAVTIAKLMADEQQSAARKGGMQGAFGADNRSTPTSTRLEGLLALERLATQRGDNEVQGWLRPVIVRGGKFVVACQVSDGPYAGGVVAAARKKEETKGNREFNDEQPEIRIDYVQHALSALIGTEKLCAAYACDP
jgi:hypothetical protein